MVKDGYFYGIPLLGAAVLLGWLANPWWSVVPALLAFFLLWFFRDPNRSIPSTAGAIVSPADGKVTNIATIEIDGEAQTRISIFLNIFNVHVNRSPISGVIKHLRYRKGTFRNAMDHLSAELNEQNIVFVEGEGHRVIFKQIAGLLARRIVFTRKIGDTVQRGERVGLIKFGSRVDVIFIATAKLEVKLGDRVKGGTSILACIPVQSPEQLASVCAKNERGGDS